MSDNNRPDGLAKGVKWAGRSERPDSIDASTVHQTNNSYSIMRDVYHSHGTSSGVAKWTSVQMLDGSSLADVFPEADLTNLTPYFEIEGMGQVRIAYQFYPNRIRSGSIMKIGLIIPSLTKKGEVAISVFDIDENLNRKGKVEFMVYSEPEGNRHTDTLSRSKTTEAIGEYKDEGIIDRSISALLNILIENTKFGDLFFNLDNNQVIPTLVEHLDDQIMEPDEA